MAIPIKTQVAGWAERVAEQSDMYADLLDPNRRRNNEIANKLDAIHRLANEIRFKLKPQSA